MMYQVDMTMTASDGKIKRFTGTLSDEVEPPVNHYQYDFTADFKARPAGYTMMNQEDWNAVFSQALGQGVTVYCLEQNTDATRHDFTIQADGSMQVFMPRGSYGMGHRSVNIRLGKVQGPVNVSYEFMVDNPGVNLWTAGGGKWGPAIQYGPIQSGSTGGIRFMPTWAAGASTLGKQDLTCSIQNQPDGGQWLQPPYYGYRPIQYDHWYEIHMRMIGGLPEEPTTVVCEYWKDADPVMKYTAETTNQNAQQGKADVMVDWTCFFGGGAANCAPADARFNYKNLRVWVE